MIHAVDWEAVRISVLNNRRKPAELALGFMRLLGGLARTTGTPRLRIQNTPDARK
jgi:hypothetical protein